MNTLRLALLAALLLPAPLVGQTPVQVTADSARAELVRTRGMIRAAETQVLKTERLLQALTSRLPGVVVIRDTVRDTVFVPMPAPGPGPTPSAPPPVVAPPAPPAPVPNVPAPPVANDGKFVVYPTPEVAAILGPQIRSGSSANPWPFFDATALAKGLEHGAAFSSAIGGDPDYFINLQYYDQALVQYLNYYRTGDVRFLENARKIADAWYTFITPTAGSPRAISLGGLMLRALDGRP